MDSFQDLSNWVVDDEENFLTVLLPNNATSESHTQINYVEKKDTDMQVFPFNNKDNVTSDKYSNDLDKYLSNWTQEDYQVSEKSDQQLTESQKIDLMTEDEKIDYLAELMLDEPCQPKTHTHQQGDEGIKNNEFNESNTVQKHNIGDGYVQNTMQYSEFKQLHNTNPQTNENTMNSEFLNLVLNNEMTSKIDNSNLYQVQHHQNNIDTMNQNEISDKKFNHDLSSGESKSELQNQTTYQNLQGDNNNQQYPIENGEIQIGNPIIKGIQCSINQEVKRKGHTIVNIKNKQNIFCNKIISVQNTTAGKNIRYIINKNVKPVQLLPVQEQVKKKSSFITDKKSILRLLQSHNINKALNSKKLQGVHKLSPIQNINSPKNEIKLPTLNKEKILSIQSGKLCVSSTVTDVKPNNVEKNDPEASSTKKRKKYEEAPLKDEEEEKKRMQAKKAKNYRDKKKEELRIKDAQIEKLQEALKNSEREKTAHIVENKQLKEDIKKKDLLIQLYEGK